MPWLNRWIRKSLSLDPQEFTPTGVGAEVALGFTPILGELTSLRDAERERRRGRYGWAALSLAGALPAVGIPARALARARRAGNAIEAAVEVVPRLPRASRAVVPSRVQDDIARAVEEVRSGLSDVRRGTLSGESTDVGRVLRVEHRTPYEVRGGQVIPEAASSRRGPVKGEERRAQQAFPELYAPRSYFTRAGEAPEAGFGALPVYEGELSVGRVYDIDADPLGLRDRALSIAQKHGTFGTGVASIFEQLIRQTGYGAYKSGRTVASFEPVSVLPSFHKSTMGAHEVVPVTGLPAPSIREAATPEEAYQLARTQQHIRRRSKGAPLTGGPWWLRSPARLDLLRGHFDDALASGVPGRDWYERSRRAIREITGGDPKKGDLAAFEMGLFSPQTMPYQNTGFGLLAHNAYEAGTPAALVRTGKQTRAYAAAREARELPPLGQKTQPFSDRVNPNQPATFLPVNDIWHARAMGFLEPGTEQPWKSGLKSAQHRFMDAETLLAAERANLRAVGGATDWDAETVQAAAWVGAKAKRLVEEKGIPWEQALREANESFAEVMPGYAARVAYETTPGATTGHLPGLLADTPEGGELRAAFHADPRNAWETAPGGRDLLYDVAGFYARPTTRAEGVFRSPRAPAVQLNPASVAQPLLARTAGGGALQPADEAVTTLVEELRAAMGAQQMPSVPQVPVTRGVRPSQLNGLRVTTSAQPTREQMQALEEVASRYGFWPSHTGDGFSLVPTGTRTPMGGDLNRLLNQGSKEESLPPLRREIQRVLGDVRVERVRFPKTAAPDNEKLWRGGKGALTRRLLQIMAASPAKRTVKRLGTDPRVRTAAGRRAEAAFDFSARAGGVSPTLINFLRTIEGAGSKTISEALRDALKRGLPLPVALAMLGGAGATRGLLAAHDN